MLLTKQPKTVHVSGCSHFRKSSQHRRADKMVQCAGRDKGWVKLNNFESTQTAVTAYAKHQAVEKRRQRVRIKLRTTLLHFKKRAENTMA